MTRNQLLAQQNKLQERSVAEARRHNQASEALESKAQSQRLGLGIAEIAVKAIPVVGNLFSSIVGGVKDLNDISRDKERQAEMERHNKKNEQLTEEGQELQSEISKRTAGASIATSILGGLTKGVGVAMLTAGLSTKFGDHSGSKPSSGSGNATITRGMSLYDTERIGSRNRTVNVPMSRSTLFTNAGEDFLNRATDALRKGNELVMRVAPATTTLLFPVPGLLTI
jgi:heme exporter protein D